MKKIVFVIESLHLGGAEKSLVTLLNNLDYSNVKVDLILLKKEGIFIKYIPKNVNVILKPKLKLTLFNRIKYKVLKYIQKNKYHPAQTFWKLINKSINNHPIMYDIAIAYNQGFSTYYVNSKITAKNKYSWLNTDYKKAGYNIRFDLSIYKNFNKVIAVSKEAKDSLINEVKINNDFLDIDIIKDITDDIIIKKQSNENVQTNFNKNKINIVTVCRLVKIKGLDLAIESCKSLLAKGYDINWYIIGEGAERDYLENLIQIHKLENNFFLVGAKTNPYTYMKACDLYVQTSLFEGLGLTVIEASILQKPIVCTNFPTSYSIIEHNKSGLICEMDAEDITKNIITLIENEELKNTFIENLSRFNNSDKIKSLSKINEIFTQ